MCKKCGDTEYVSIEKPEGGYTSHPCPDCKPALYKKWIKKQAISPLTTITIIKNEALDAIFIGALATKKALATLHNSMFEMSIMGLISDSIKLAEVELKRTLSEWSRPIIELTIKSTLLQEKAILEKRDEYPTDAGPMKKRRS